MDRLFNGIWVRLLVGIVALGITVGCSPSGADAAAEPGPATGGAKKTSDTKQAADFTLPVLGGGEYQLAQSTASVRLIDFWATWCAPCREEIPMFLDLHQIYGPQGFEIVAISDEEPDEIQAFLNENGIDYVNLHDDGGRVSEDYNVLGLPTAFLVDAEGNVLRRFFGPKPRKVLEREIRSALGLPEAG